MSDPRAQLLALCLSSSKEISQECQAVVADGSTERRATDSISSLGLFGCGMPLVQLLARQASKIVDLYQRQEEEANLRALYESAETRLVGTRLDDILSISYSRFYAYVFEKLPACWRQLYTDTAILKFSFLFLFSSLVNDPQFPGPSCTRGSTGDEDEVDSMVKTLDLALILAGAAGETRGRQWIDKALNLLEGAWKERHTSLEEDSVAAGRPRKRMKLSPALSVYWTDTPSFSSFEPFTPPVKNPIPRVPRMSMAAFQFRLDHPADRQLGPQPFIITKLTDEWPARTSRPWDRPAYLLSRTFGGHRRVPLEIGRSYVDQGWGQKILPFGEFLHEYIDHLSSDTTTSPNKDGRSDSADQRQEEQSVPGEPPLRPPVAYLAQHPLFTQLPTLRNDILVPDYCYTSPPRHPTDPSQDRPELDAPQVNAWLGPPGTITPLHTDPYHNLLAQVVGRKYVRLYSPLEGRRMRARGREDGVDMGNTSTVDVGVVEGWDRVVERGVDVDEENVDAEDLPEDFKEVPYVDCILDPGDTLYIPIGWWHYVRGLSVSFSVSFWWN